jgi:hypothetical protein
LCLRACDPAAVVDVGAVGGSRTEGASVAVVLDVPGAQSVGQCQLEAIESLAGAGAGGRRLIDVVLASSAGPPAPLVARYAESGAAPVTVDRAAIEASGAELVETDLLCESELAHELIRHDPEKLRRAVAELTARGTAAAAAQEASAGRRDG